MMQSLDGYVHGIAGRLEMPSLGVALTLISRIKSRQSP
jgi:hypothetical protein